MTTGADSGARGGWVGTATGAKGEGLTGDDPRGDHPLADDSLADHRR